MMDSIELTDRVAKRFEDRPTNTIVTWHEIVKATIAELVEEGFIAYAGCAECGLTEEAGDHNIAETDDDEFGEGYSAGHDYEAVA